MKTFRCSACGRRVFFENLHCVACGAGLGFDPAQLELSSFAMRGVQWTRVGTVGDSLVPCIHREDHVCNWMVPLTSASGCCLCCATTHVIPDLQRPGNVDRWRKLEVAKHRLFFSLLSMRLPVHNKLTDPARGMSFHFLEQILLHEQVMTGHADGVITINIAEADDAFREQVRTRMNEPYRTLLGHLRHEVGHYYWDLLIRDSPWLERYRQRFGDERMDYASALKNYYEHENGDWRLRFVSRYASAHPWEDWAECWAHYMHIQDTMETAAAWGLSLKNAVPDSAPVVPSALDHGAQAILPTLIEEWLPLSQFVNAMDRSLGSSDSYPFTLPTPVLEKLAFIHQVIADASGTAALGRGLRTA